MNCKCGCASCPTHRASNCTHTTPSNPIDVVPTDVARAIQRPGVTVRKSLAQVLGLRPDSRESRDWLESMTALDRQSGDSGTTPSSGAS